MGLKRLLSGNGFTRLVLVSWIIGAISILVLFKNMELIVHGQLYYYGLRFSADWADPYRIYTWLLFLCLGLPMALSGLALVSSFFKVEEVSEKKKVVPQGLKRPQRVAKAESSQILREVPKKAENGNGGGIYCTYCEKVFRKPLVMLDFHGGKNQLVSVCPYCNHVLVNTSDEKSTNEDYNVPKPDEKAIR